MKRDRKMRMALIVMMIGLSLVAIIADAAGVKAKGTLTEIREDGTAFIDDHGYALSHFVKVVDGQGKLTSLDKLMLPTVVQYEYMFRKNEGPAIRVIRELPQ